MPGEFTHWSADELRQPSYDSAFSGARRVIWARQYSYQLDLK